MSDHAPRKDAETPATGNSNNFNEGSYPAFDPVPTDKRTNNNSVQSHPNKVTPLNQAEEMHSTNNQRPGNQQDRRPESQESIRDKENKTESKNNQIQIASEEEAGPNNSGLKGEGPLSNSPSKDNNQEDEKKKVTLPANLVGKDYETLMARYNGVFHVHGKTSYYDKRSLYLLDAKWGVRKGLVWLIEWKWFDRFITFVILLNSALLASTDYGTRLDPEHDSWWTPTQEKIDTVFTYIFIVECVSKVLGMGFFVNKNAYLRDGWNWLDFFIVCVSLVGIFGLENDSLKALRTFRILRPLRSINAMPTMRDLIESLMASIPGLVNVIAFLAFIFGIFAIFGVNQFLGKNYQFCRTSEEIPPGPYTEFAENWEKDPNVDWLCMDDASCKAFNPEGVGKCGTVYEAAKLDPLVYDDIINNELVMFGIPGFDQFGQALITIFQVLTLESWSYLLYNYSDASDPTISIVFFTLVVVFGSFFTMNLVLAQIMDSFVQQQEKKDAEALEREEEAAREAKHDAEEAAKKADQVDVAENQVQTITIQESNVSPLKESVQTSKAAYQTQARFDSIQQSQNNEGGLLPAIGPDPGQRASIAIENIQEMEKRVGQGEQVLSQESVPVEKNERRMGDVLDQDDEQVSKIEIRDQSKDAENIKKNLKDLNEKVADLQLQHQESTVLYEDEEDHEIDARKRSYRNCCYRQFYLMVTAVWFNFFIFCLIIGNTFTLAVFTYDQSEETDFVLQIFNYFFTGIFAVEMVTKLIGLGFDNYRRDSYNVFDSVIVIISLVDLALSLTPGIDAGDALTAMRALRLLRMIKLSRSWAALQDILTKTVASLKDISNFSLLLFLFMFIFALLGMELFANIALIDEDENLVVGAENVQALFATGIYEVPRDNFNNVGFALTTIFIVIVGEDWNWTMYQWVRAYGSSNRVQYYIAIFYFLLLMIIGNIVLFSLFTAILLQNFEEGMNEKISEGADETVDEENKVGFFKRITSKEFWDGFSEQFQEAFGKKKAIAKQPKLSEADQLKDMLKQQSDLSAKSAANKNSNNNDGPEGLFAEDQNNGEAPDAKELLQGQRPKCSLIHYAEPPEMNMLGVTGKSSVIQKPTEEPKLLIQGRALFCFSETNPLRRCCAAIATSKVFENIILILIVLSTLTLALETPLDDPKGKKIEILGYIDIFMTASFTIEALLKIIALGFAFNGKPSYIRDAWNVLDIVIVISALTGLIAGDAIDISFIKALRILRILRPLRLIARNKGLKVAITSLFNSIPSIVNLLIIVYFFIFLLAILQTTIFSGKFYRCHTEHLDLSFKQQKENIVTMMDCLNYGGEWVKPDLNFDTTLDSLLSLLTIQSTEGWIDVMWDSVDAVDPYYQPRVNNQPLNIIYMMLMVVIICMLFLNLFVGVVIETFNREKERLSYNQMLKSSQKSWITVQLLCTGVQPQIRLETTGNCLRDACIKLTTHKAFDGAIMIFIMLNTLVLAFNWYMMPLFFMPYLEAINYFFMIVFTIEAILKIIAMKGAYFRDSWNLFDFTVVVLTAVILGVKFLGFGSNLAMMSTMLRTLRIGRVFRLVKRAKKLQIIFQTLIDSAPSMGSLGLLLMLLMFMFAIIGMSQFAMVDLDGASEMNYHANFQTFGSAFLTLLRCSTGEAWNSIMFDSSRPRSILFQCNEVEDYGTIVEDGRDPTDLFGPKGCGKKEIAVGFHIFFQIMVSQIFLNLFIAIIVDSFIGQTDAFNLPVQQNAIDQFVEIWAQYDPQATGFIALSKFENFLIDISESDTACDLVTFGPKIATNQSFRRRFIINLEIPTFNNFDKVMFYDVLMQFTNQIVKLYHNREKIAENKQKLRVIKMLGGTNQDDTLEAINSLALKSDYDVDFDDLIGQMHEANSKIELVSDLRDKTKKLKKTYNNYVDSTYKIGTKRQENFSLKKSFAANNASQAGLQRQKTEKVEAIEPPSNIPYEVYTTRHWIQANLIAEVFLEFQRHKRDNPSLRSSSPMEGARNARTGSLHAIREEESAQEQTNLASRLLKNQANASGVSAGGRRNPDEEGGAAGQQQPGSVLSIDEEDFSEAVVDTAFHNDKRNLK